MEINKEVAQDYFTYSGGKLFWKKPTSVRVHVGREVGGETSHGYRCLAIFGRSIYAHRLVWIYHNGPIAPGLVIDHVNGDTLDNRLENLRAVPQALNCRNQKPTKRNKSGYVGIYQTEDNTWAAQIKVANKTVSLGCHRDIQTALVARVAAEKVLGYLTHTHSPKRV